MLLDENGKFENVPLNSVHRLCKANIVFFRVNVVQLKIESTRFFLGYSLTVWLSPWAKNTRSILCPRPEQDDDVDGG